MLVFFFIYLNSNKLSLTSINLGKTIIFTYLQIFTILIIVNNTKLVVEIKSNSWSYQATLLLLCIIL